MPKEKLTFSYSPDSHITICDRMRHNKIYRGTAKCHPDDYNFESKLVGEHYAYLRTIINELCDKRDEIYFQLKILLHLQNLFEQNEQISEDIINDRDEASRILNKQIKILTRDLKDIRVLIKETKSDLRLQFKERDKLHAKITANRKKEAMFYTSNE